MSFPIDLRDLDLKHGNTAGTPMVSEGMFNTMASPVVFMWANWAAAWTVWGDLTAKTFGLVKPSSFFFPDTADNQNAVVSNQVHSVSAGLADQNHDALLPASESDVVHTSASPADARPVGLGFPRAGKADDLKMISGVGPKIEKTLHALGIFHFDQIASWTKAEAKWVDSYLNFKGRALREDWVAQADALATGGRDEYVKRFGKEPR